MEVRCKKCGRPLSDPVSIALGMGSQCAGFAGKGKSFRTGRRGQGGTVYPSVGKNLAHMDLFSFGEEHLKRVPEALEKFPSDLQEITQRAESLPSLGVWVETRIMPRFIPGVKSLPTWGAGYYILKDRVLPML